MKEVTIENIFYDYVQGDIYGNIPTHEGIKAVDEKIEKELLKLELTAEQREHISDVAYQYMTAGELQGFIHGFKYASAIMVAALSK